MATTVSVYEIQDNFQVKKTQSTLRFTKKCNKSLYIVTTKQSSASQKHTQHGEGDATETVQAGISYTVLTVNGGKWELRLILNPKEISEIFSKFNFIGFLNALLTSTELKGEVLLEKKQQKEMKKTIITVSKMAAQFLSSSASLSKSFSKRLAAHLTQNWEGHTSICREQKDSLGPALCVALLAVIIAALSRDFMKEREYENSDNEGDEDEEEEEEEEEEEKKKEVFDNHFSNGSTGGTRNENHENIKQQFSALKNVFNINEKLTCLSQNHKKVYVVAKENKSEGCQWDSNPVHSVREKTVHYGINHKVLCVCSKDWEVQLLQNLNQSFNIFTTFNMTGFADSLLMSKKWQNKLNLLLENKKETSKIIKEISKLAATFMCDTEQQKHRDKFIMKLKDTLESKLGKNNLKGCNPAGNVVTALFGTVLVITASLLAKRIMEKPDEGGEASTAQMGTLVVSGEGSQANKAQKGTSVLSGEGSEPNTAQRGSSIVSGEGSEPIPSQAFIPVPTGEVSGAKTAHGCTPAITGEGNGANSAQERTPTITSEGNGANSAQERTPAITDEGNGSNTAQDSTPTITSEVNGANTAQDSTPAITGEVNGANTAQERTPAITDEGNGANTAHEGTPAITGEGNGANTAQERTPAITDEGNGANTAQDGTPAITGEGNGANTVQDSTPAITGEGNGANTAQEHTPAIYQ